MISIGQKVEQVEDRLKSADLTFGQGSDSATDEAIWIVLHVLGIDDGECVDWEVQLGDKENVAIDELLERRIDTRLPLAYLINEAWFAGLKFYVDRRTIIPRSYLSEWIPEGFEPWIKAENVSSILDLCTGSGCIAISCAHYFGNATVLASDLSKEALEVAQINVERHRLEERVKLNQGDLFERINQKFDLIVCNPPYVSDRRVDILPEGYRLEPEIAFRGGVNGLDFIDRLLQQASTYLNEEGVLVVEAGSASRALEEKYSDIPFNWLSTEYDEMAVFLISHSELKRYL